MNDQYELFYSQDELNKIVLEESKAGLYIGLFIGTVLTLAAGIALHSLGLLCA